MEALRLLRVLRRRAWLIILCVVVASVTAAIVAKALKPVYTAQSSVVVNPAQPLIGNDINLNVTSDQVARTYASLAVQTPILQQVIADLHLSSSPDELAKSVSVVPQANTTILTVSVNNTDPQLAARIANQLTTDFLASAKNIQLQRFTDNSKSLNDQIKALTDQQAKDQADLDALNRSITKTATSEQQATIANLQAQIASEQRQELDLRSTLSSFTAQIARGTDNLVVVSPATTPGSPTSPKLPLDVALAAITALILGLLAAFLLEQFDHSIRSEEELRDKVGLTRIGQIGRFNAPRGRGSELVALNPQSVSAEAYRSLRTNLLFSTVDRTVKTIVITSSLAGEGKSRTSANLGIVLAAAGHSTLLVDADLRRPSVHRVFGRTRNVGLTNLFLGEAPDTQVVRPVDGAPRLSILMSGPTPPNPSELLGSAQMQQILATLRERFEFIILDTPPVNVFTDASVLASQADATLLVVEFGRTSSTALRHAKEELERVGARILGVVVNKVSSGSDSYYYYGGDSYRSYDSNGNGASQAADRAAQERATAKSR